MSSVESQTYPNCEIIIVDGGSNDAQTLAILEKLNQDGVRVLFREERHFVADNRNFGVEKARGDFVCCLDADDLMHPTFLEKSFYLMMAGGLDIVSTSAQLFGSEDMIEMASEFPSVEKSLHDNEINTLALVRKDLWLKVGGMRDWGMGKDYIFEDWDFWIRCMMAGAKVRNVIREPLFHYRKHGDASLSNQSGESRALEFQRAAILEANKSKIDEYRKNGCSTYDIHPPVEYYEMDSQAEEDTLLVSCFSQWFDHFSIENGDQPKSGRKLNLLCLENDPRGRKFVEFHAHRLDVSVFELPRFLDSEKMEPFIRTFWGVRGHREFIWLDALHGQVLRRLEDDLTSLIQQKRSWQIEPREKLDCAEEIQVVKISPISACHPMSRSNLIWLAGIDSTDPKMIDLFLTRMDTAVGWEKRECHWSPTGFVFETRMDGDVNLELPSSVKLLFLAHSHGGMIQISSGEESAHVDLYAAKQKYVRVNAAMLKSLRADPKSYADVGINIEANSECSIPVELRVLSEKNSASHGFEVWLEDIRFPNGHSAIQPNLSSDGSDSWSFVENKSAPRGYAYLGSPGPSLKLFLPLGSQLFFLRHGWSGIVEVTYESTTTKIDLFSEDREIFQFELAEALDETFSKPNNPTD